MISLFHFDNFMYFIQFSSAEIENESLKKTRIEIE
jgi:hypothetical protein